MDSESWKNITGRKTKKKKIEIEIFRCYYDAPARRLNRINNDYISYEAPKESQNPEARLPGKSTAIIRTITGYPRIVMAEVRQSIVEGGT